MKKFKTILIIIFISIFSCKEKKNNGNINSEKISSEIHFQVGFDKSRTKIYQNGKEIFSDTLTTEDQLALAEIFEYRFDKDSKVKIIVESDSVFLSIKKNYIIAISWNQDKREIWYNYLSTDNDIYYD